MAKNLGALTVWLGLDSRKFQSGFAGAKRTLTQWKAATTVAAAGATAALGAFGVSSVKAFMESEKATNDLSAALKNSGDATAYTIPALQKFASEMQKQTTFEDDAIISAMAYGKNLGIQTSQLDDAAKAAAGLAAKYRIDLQTAMQLLGRASQGQTQMLSRYGIVLDNGLSPQEKFNQLLKIGSDNFGLAQAQTNTLSGKLIQLENIWGDLKETVGELIVDLLNLSGVFDAGRGGMQSWVDTLKNNLPAIAFTIRSVFIEVKYGLIQTGTLISNLLEPIFSVIKTAGKNIWSLISWIWENIGKLFSNIPNLVVALIKDIWQMFSGVDFWTALFSGQSFEEAFAGQIGNIGKNLEIAMGKAGISKLEIAEPDYSAWTRIIDDIARIDKDKARALDDLFNRSMEKAGAAPVSPGGTPRAVAAAEAKKSRWKQETSVTAAVQRGSAEALKIENTRATKEDKIEKSTAKTAKNSDKTVNLLQKISDSLSAGGNDIEFQEAI